MCYARLLAELFSRKDVPSPVSISSKTHPVYPATFGSLKQANRLLISSIMEFAECSFPEFRELSDAEKAGNNLSVTVRFYYTFHVLDNSYRTTKHFVDLPNRSFGSYTLWLSDEVNDQFFDDYDEENEDVKEAKKFMTLNLDQKLGRRIVEQVNPDEEEFIALIALVFWATYGLDLSDKVTRLGEQYRDQLLSEIHVYYREVLNLENYAARLGELYMIIPMFERQGKQTFDVFRRLDIHNDNCGSYTLNM